MGCVSVGGLSLGGLLGCLVGVGCGFCWLLFCRVLVVYCYCCITLPSYVCTAITVDGGLVGRRMGGWVGGWVVCGGCWEVQCVIQVGVMVLGWLVVIR